MGAGVGEVDEGHGFLGIESGVGGCEGDGLERERPGGRQDGGWGKFWRWLGIVWAEDLGSRIGFGARNVEVTIAGGKLSTLW